MRLIGLEPTRRETPDPKSGASTNFATGAWCKLPFLLLPCKDSANRVKKKINLVYFFFRGAAYLIQSSANLFMKKKINLVYFFFRGAAYLIQSSANLFLKKKINLVYFFFFAVAQQPVRGAAYLI